MRFLGFNFIRINARTDAEPKIGKIGTNIDFVDVTKEKVSALNNLEVLKILFKFTIDYNNIDEKKKDPAAQLSFEGTILFSSSDEEMKPILKGWKKKDLPEEFRIALTNLILRKCSVKALSLEEELGLPPHFPFPYHLPKGNQQKK